VKKQKSLKQNETSCEAATPAQLSAQALPSVATTASKLLKQSSMRDRNRRARPNKVSRSVPDPCRKCRPISFIPSAVLWVASFVFSPSEFFLYRLGACLTGPYSLQVPTSTPAGVGIPWSTSEDQVSVTCLS